jgi:CheY-like chemotaxis protein
MPRKDGIEAMRAIRALRADVPVLLSSGFHEQDATERCAADGVSGFVHKPYSIDALIAKLRLALPS